MEKLYTIIIAAGKGTRMNSDHSKLVQKIYGKELVKRVANLAEDIHSQKVVVVVGYKKEEVQDALKELKLEYREQKELLGTGHAVKIGMDALKDVNEGKVIILYGDVPILRKKTIEKLIETNIEKNEKVTLLTAIYQNPTGYGRIVRDKNGNLDKIVEQKDATEEEKNIKEINAGIYCFDIKELKEALEELKPNNAQNEYYLTDTVEIIKSKGHNVGTYILEDNTEILGVNDRIQLEFLTRVLRNRINTEHMALGVTIEDINATYIYDDVEIGKDTVISPNTVIKSGTKIGKNCIIGYNVYIGENVTIEDNIEIESNTVILAGENILLNR